MGGYKIICFHKRKRRLWALERSMEEKGEGISQAGSDKKIHNDSS